MRFCSRQVWSAAFVLTLALAFLVANSLGAAEMADPHPPAMVGQRVVGNWDFSAPEHSWPAIAQAKGSVEGGHLTVHCLGVDPQLRIPVSSATGPLVLTLRMRTRCRGPAEFFWATKDDPALRAERSVRLTTINDGSWHEYTIRLPVEGQLELLRFDPCTSLGDVELSHAWLVQPLLHPLQFADVAVDGRTIRIAVQNISAQKQTITFGGQSYDVEPGQVVRCVTVDRGTRPFEVLKLSVHLLDSEKPPLTRTVHVHRPEAKGDWIQLRGDRIAVLVARDGTGARILRDGKLAAVLSPLVKPAAGLIEPTVSADGSQVSFRGNSFRSMTLRVAGDELFYNLDSPAELTGPVVRAIGTLEQGLLAGVEQLGRDEPSSSTADVRRSEHIRFEPNPLHVTMPLAAIVTDRGSVALGWNDMSLQPVFATPNRYDGSSDHLMALKGRRIGATIRVGAGFADGGRLEDAIVWAVRRRALPPLPKPPRSVDAQRELCLRALTGPLATDDGWQHAATPRFPAHYYADHASTIWRLTGELPEVPTLVPGGSHIRDPASFFLSGQAAQWRDTVNRAARQIASEQHEDGSFRYRGKYRDGHFEDTASGYCAQRAVSLLDHARWTGDSESLTAGLKCLEYMKRFRTPRGAQVWEIPLHTPDIYAAAHLVQAYVAGFELTGRDEYLDLARRWAIRGVPFVYQWGRHPIMPYATIAVLGATDWVGVVWIGLPVQWCGGCYADAILRLEPHDKTLPWRRFAEGILVAAEQMQYPDGPWVGCLPDSFALADQRRLPAAINPCSLVILRNRLMNQPSGIATATEGKHRIVSPLPVTISDGKARIEGREGLTYQVLVDGKHVVTVNSKGEDVIDLQRVGAAAE